MKRHEDLCTRIIGKWEKMNIYELRIESNCIYVCCIHVQLFDKFFCVLINRGVFINIQSCCIEWFI